MHLEGPWLSTTGKKKGKQKWASAEAKHKAKVLQDEWNAKLKQWGLEAEEKRRKRGLSAPPLTVTVKVPAGRETPYIASKDTGWEPCLKPTDKVYTGTKVKGIGTMHKSNAVPIFSDEEAVDISKMRR
jgi:hypothetical protein